MNLPISIVWKALAWEGIERCNIQHANGRYIVSSRIQGEISEKPFDFEYDLQIDEQWRIVAVQIGSSPHDRQIIDLQTDANGNWSNSQSIALPDFFGCMDIDISLSPFTNTLPIRRLDYKDRRKHDIAVVYIDLPSGHLKRMRQWYEKVGDRIYRYEDETGYVNIITVDEYGFVMNYPGLFESGTD